MTPSGIYKRVPCNSCTKLGHFPVYCELPLLHNRTNTKHARLLKKVLIVWHDPRHPQFIPIHGYPLSCPEVSKSAGSTCITNNIKQNINQECNRTLSSCVTATPRLKKSGSPLKLQSMGSSPASPSMKPIGAVTPVMQKLEPWSYAKPSTTLPSTVISDKKGETSMARKGRRGKRKHGRK